MLKITFTREAYKFIRDLDAKQYRQVVGKTLTLMVEPEPSDSSMLQGSSRDRRIDIGEFHIIYTFDETTVFIELVGKRNDDEIYRQYQRRR